MAGRVATGVSRTSQLGPGKRTLTEGLATGTPGSGGATGLLSPAQLAVATRSNPIYHAQLHYDPVVFGAGADVGTEGFAQAVARYQQQNPPLAVDGMAGPQTAKRIGALPADAPEMPAPEAPAVEAGGTTGTTGATATTTGTTTPSPEPVAPPPPAPVQPRSEQTEYGSFLVYPDDFVGPLPPNGPQGENVHESEFKKLVAEREKAAVAKREQTVSRVDDLLSYGAFDWRISDGEAREALDLLAALPMSQLQNAIGRINAQRLLDNLPSAARRTASFARVIIAMGPDRYRPFVSELLSYGVLDWAIRDADVQVVIDILAVLPAPQQEALLESLDATHLSRLARNLSRGVQVSNAMLNTLFRATPDSDLAALEAIFERRFNVELSTWFLRRWQMSVKEKWDAKGLRRLWVIFGQLPPGHIQDNDKLETFLRAGQQDGSGVYYEGPDAGVVEYSDITHQGGYGQILVDDGAGGKKDVGLNSNVNTFSTVVRHEIGHAVDAKIGASTSYATTAANAGAWKSYGSATEFVDAIIADGGGMSGHGYPDEAAYRKAMHRAVSKTEDFTVALQNVDPAVAAPAAAVKGPVAAVYESKLWDSEKSPWYNAGDRQDVGGRLWQRPYGSGEYVSFQKAARTAHGVSAYQFRAPGEWFAEAYAVYYSDQDTPGAKVGTRLRTRDAATADWFDTNVDKGHSLGAETGTGTGGGSTGPVAGGGANAQGGAGRTGGSAGGGAGAVARAPGGGAGGGAGGHG